MKTLHKIFPFYILILFTFPIIIGYFIQPELVISRYIFVHILWIPLFTIPFIIFKNKGIVYFFTTLIFILGLSEIIHWAILKGPITITSLLVISNTNFQESLEFLDLTANFRLLLLIPYILIFYLALKQIKKLDLQLVNYKIISIVALVSTIFITENYYNNRLLRRGSPQSVNLIFTLINQLDLYKELLKNPEPKEIIAKAIDNEGKTFVLIIGESLSRNHLSLYNYTKNTNPKLSQRTDLIKFNNVISPYSTTLETIFSILTVSNLEKPVEKNKAIDIIDVFHSAGFETYWISNQSPFGIWDNMITLFAKKSDHFTFVNTSSNSSFEATLNVSYDEKVIPPFQKILKNEKQNKLIIIHLMGSHSNYAKRYPEEFDVFSGTDSKEQVIAEYDNSVLYNDFIIDSILNIFSNYSQNNNSKNSLIYLSDHGENVYDFNDQVGHGFSGKLHRQNVDIPFLVWLAPNFDSKKDSIINSNTNKPYVTDDLLHSILDLNQIETSFYTEKRSLFNENFDSTRKRILGDKNDYDAK